MAAPARRCAHPGGCRRATTDGSGLCWQHRGARPATTAFPAPPAPVPAASGAPEERAVALTEPDEDGGYDEHRVVPTQMGRVEQAPALSVDPTASRVELYRRGGGYHREDGPALVVYHPSGRVLDERWCLDNQLDRPDGPARTSYVPTRDGVRVAREEWRTVGLRHRTDGGPALTQYDQDGKPAVEEWWVEGERVNPTGGPTRVQHGATATAPDMHTVEEWVNSERIAHRLDGPAVVTRDPRTGEVLDERWYLHGRPQPPAVVRAVARLGEQHTRAVDRAFVAGVRTERGLVRAVEGEPVDLVVADEQAGLPEPAGV